MELGELYNKINQDLTNVRFTLDQRGQLTAILDNVFSQLITRFENRKDGILLLEEAYLKAVKLGLTAYAIESSRLLKTCHMLEQNNRRSTLYKKRSLLHLQQLDYEFKAQDFLDETVKRLIGIIGYHKDLTDQIQLYLNDIESWEDNYKTPFIFYCFYQLKIYRSQLSDKPELVIKNCNEAIRFFDKNKASATRAAHFTFRFSKITPYISLQQYEEALKTIQESLKLTKKGERNWHVLSRMEVTILFYKRAYSQANNIYLKSEQYWKRAAPDVLEQWQIIKGYLQFLTDVGLLQKKGRYNVGQFLKKLPIYSKDKTGNNTNIHIISMLLSLTRNRDILIDRKLTIRKYCNQYLPKNSRQALFMKMLLCCVTGKFQKAKVQELAIKYQEQLPTDKNPEIELIPYEDLWEIIIKKLLES